MPSLDELEETYKRRMTYWTTTKGWADYIKAFPPRSELFVEKKYLRGSIPQPTSETLRLAITQAPVIEINNESIVPGVAISSLNPNDIKLLNSEHQYRAFTVEVEKALASAFEAMREPVAQALNSPWRVLNCRSWTTTSGAKHGPNAWHMDGDYEEILKMMIYSSPTGWGQGGLQVETTTPDKVLNVQGAQGQWILFYNSVLKHRAMAPEKEGIERVATEVTICPSWGYDLRPKFVGLVGRYHNSPTV